MSDRRISRRNFLRTAATLAGAAAVGSLAAACGPTPTPQVIEIEKIVKETVVVKQEVTKVVEKSVEKVVTTVVEKPVEKVVTKEVVKEVTPTGGEIVIPYLTALWVWQKLNAANATEAYNQENRGKVRVQVDPAPDGWETKVREMVQKKDVKWDGAQVNQSNFGGEIGLVQMGIIQDPNPYLQASKNPWAAKLMGDLTATAKTYFSWQGKVWYIPWDSELYIRHYLTAEWGKLGEKPAEVMDDYKKQLLELAKMFPKKIGICWRRDGGCDHMLQQMFPEEPYLEVDVAGTKQWTLNAKSEAYAYALDFYKWAWQNKLMTAESWSPGAGGGPWAEVWNRGDGLTTMTGAAWAFAQARKVWGRDAIAAEPIPVLKKGTTPATHTFSNGASIFVGAKHPQEVVDYLLWMTDPTVPKGGVTNYSFWKGILDYYHVPAYKSVFETHIPTNPDWKWMEKMLPMLNNSKSEPAGIQWLLLDGVKDPWKLKYVQGQCTLKEAQEAISKECLAALEKFVGTLKK